ncbi:MAG: hypothetical protein NTV49_08715 [Kiritimatiellaeota bacterium]|nr:hypothetical protein [Kiritimatiellota bacterium]
MKTLIAGCAALLAGQLFGAAARAEMPAEQARAILQAHQDAVLLVLGTIKFANAKNAGQVAVAGTVVDASGLVIISSSVSAAEWKNAEQSLRFVLPDGAEIPARLVLSDDDLALAVLASTPRPGEPRPVFKPVALDRDAQAAVYTDVVTLGRLGKEYHYRPAADTGKVLAVTTHPRTLYLIDANPGGPYRHGLPTFLADGRLLGINTIKRAGGAARRPGGMSLPPQAQEIQERLVPAAALAELLEQARQAAGPPAAER